MTPYRVTWHPAAERALLAIPNWRIAQRIAEAVETFARTGVGNPERANQTTWRLRVAGHAIIFSMNSQTRELLVWAIVKSSTK